MPRLPYALYAPAIAVTALLAASAMHGAELSPRSILSSDMASLDHDEQIAKAGAAAIRQ
jgi:hypothetical protein